MKKLMIAAAVAMVAVASQAVQVKWGSLNFYEPGKDGSIADKVTWNGTVWQQSTSGKITANNAVEAFVWESATADIVSFNSGDLWNWYSNGKEGTPLAGSSAYTGKNGSASTITVSGGNTYVAGDTAYAAILYVYTDGDGNKWYMEQSTEVLMKNSATTQTGLAIFQGGGQLNDSSNTLTSWTAAPEPTSGLLLLIGVGALALRRRRA